MSSVYCNIDGCVKLCGTHSTTICRHFPETLISSKLWHFLSQGLKSYSLICIVFSISQPLTPPQFMGQFVLLTNGQDIGCRHLHCDIHAQLKSCPSQSQFDSFTCPEKLQKVDAWLYIQRANYTKFVLNDKQIKNKGGYLKSSGNIVA